MNGTAKATKRFWVRCVSYLQLPRVYLHTTPTEKFSTPVSILKFQLVYLGTASLARGLSDYIDALANNAISDALTDAMPVNVNFLSKYPDFLSLAFVALLTSTYMI